MQQGSAECRQAADTGMPGSGWNREPHMRNAHPIPGVASPVQATHQSTEIPAFVSESAQVC